eukprot:Em0008g912a
MVRSCSLQEVSLLDRMGSRGSLLGAASWGAPAPTILRGASPPSRVCVIERDRKYTRASTVRSVGSIRQQFSVRGNIKMSLHSVGFIKELAKHLGVEGEVPPDVQFVEGGYLFLASEGGEQTLRDNFETQSLKFLIPNERSELCLTGGIDAPAVAKPLISDTTLERYVASGVGVASSLCTIAGVLIGRYWKKPTHRFFLYYSLAAVLLCAFKLSEDVTCSNSNFSPLVYQSNVCVVCYLDGILVLLVCWISAHLLLVGVFQLVRLRGWKVEVIAMATVLILPLACAWKPIYMATAPQAKRTYMQGCRLPATGDPYVDATVAWVEFLLRVVASFAAGVTFAKLVAGSCQKDGLYHRTYSKTFKTLLPLFVFLLVANLAGFCRFALSVVVAVTKSCPRPRRCHAGPDSAHLRLTSRVLPLLCMQGAKGFCVGERYSVTDGACNSTTPERLAAFLQSVFELSEIFACTNSNSTPELYQSNVCVVCYLDGILVLLVCWISAYLLLVGVFQLVRLRGWKVEAIAMATVLILPLACAWKPIYMVTAPKAGQTYGCRLPVAGGSAVYVSMASVECLLLVVASFAAGVTFAKLVAGVVPEWRVVPPLVLESFQDPPAPLCFPAHRKFGGLLALCLLRRGGCEEELPRPRRCHAGPVSAHLRLASRVLPVSRMQDPMRGRGVCIRFTYEYRYERFRYYDSHRQ